MVSVSQSISTQYAINTSIRLDVTATTEPERNRSKIDFKMYLIVNNWSQYAYSSWMSNAGTRIENSLFDDKNFVMTTVPFTVIGDGTGSGSALMATGTTYINHSSTGVGGSKRFSVSVRPNINAIQNQPMLILSGSIGLDNINIDSPSLLISKPSTWTVGSSNPTVLVANNNLNTNIPRSYYHQISLRIAGVSATTTVGNRTGTGSVTLDFSSVRNNMTGKVSATGTLTLLTYKYQGGNVIGLNSYNITISNPGALNPGINSSITVSIEDTNIVVKNLLNSSNHFIAGLSIAKITIPSNKFNIAGGKSISEYQVQILSGDSVLSDITSGNNVITINLPSFSPNLSAVKSQTWTFRCRAKDNSGIWTDFVTIKSATVYNWTMPSGNGSATRRSSPATTVDVSINAKYTPITHNNRVINPLNVQLQHRANDSDSWTNTVNAFTTSSTSGTGSWNTIKTGVATNVSERYQLVLRDGLGTININLNSIGTEVVPVDFGRYGIGVGTFASDAKSASNLQVGTNGVNSQGVYRWNGNEIQNYKLSQYDGHAMWYSGDWNELFATGFYRQSGGANKPPGTGWVIILVIRYDTQHAIQLCWDMDKAPRMFFRKYQRAWSPWVMVSTTNV
ncbi:hypothetical protein JXA27_06965 [Aerococcaceae bacterium zg-B36]|uniref:hypothetical protein n=1 Tax=Aerococcaceae bacterium zg-252 TaxID=2796928 RepID=UPI001BD8D831|nr:hypothetical protein [Aerococcaceae bacterium zg-B36]